MRKIITDCDGVLVDWMSTFHEWMTNEGHTRIGDSYELDERYDVPKETADSYLRYFNMSAEIEWLPPLRDSIKYVKKLHEENGFTFHCITALGRNKKSHRLRERNLKRLFGDSVFSQIDCVARGRNKRPYLEKYKDTDTVWIEDSVKLAIEGHELGLRSFLINHDHNKDVDLPEGITRVSNWKEIYENIV